MTRCLTWSRAADAQAPRSVAQARLFPTLLGLSILPFFGVAALSGAEHTSARPHPSGASGDHMSFSLYVLSRGSGVPESASQALQRFRDLLKTYENEGVSVRTSETRIGLEGERRICAEFEEKDAADEAWRRAETIVAGVDLVNLKAEPCSG
jgi:hypothetical protein